MSFDGLDEETLREILNGVLDAIIMIDERGIIESFNVSAVRMFGYQPEEVRGLNVSVLMDTDHAPAHDGYLENYARTGKKRIIGIGREVNAMRRDGTMFPVDLGVTEHRVGGRRIYVGILRDLTARRELEAQLRQSQKIEAVGTLAAGVAHDFNNILMGVRGCIKIAAAKVPEDSPAQRFLSEAQTAALRGTKLTKQLLDFARRMPAVHKRLSFNETVADSEVLLERLLDSNVKLVTKLEASKDEIRGDRSQIEQVIVNLVVNARDAMEDGGTITLKTSNVSRTGAKQQRRVPHIRMTVEDEGEGMTDVTISRIFEPFFTTKSPDKGTGLGLSTVYGIVEEHRGIITVKSVVGQGTRFDVDFPLLQTA